MDCVHPLAPDNEELLQLALDGEALSPEAAGHLEECAICRERLASFQKINAELLSRFYRSSCPDGSKLSYYCAGLLPADEQLRIAAHVRDCPLCAEEAAMTRRFLAEPLLPPQRAPALRRVFGTLVRRQAQLVLRGEAEESSWPRQYRAEDIDLSLHLSRSSNGGYILLGIITSIDSQESVDAFEGVEVALYSVSKAAEDAEADGALPDSLPGTSLACTKVDDLGNIVFSSVPVGKYVMIVHLPDREVVIKDLVVEAAGASSHSRP